LTKFENYQILLNKLAADFWQQPSYLVGERASLVKQYLHQRSAPQNCTHDSDSECFCLGHHGILHQGDQWDVSPYSLVVTRIWWQNLVAKFD
jgi:hypothetical protein